MQNGHMIGTSIGQRPTCQLSISQGMALQWMTTTRRCAPPEVVMEIQEHDENKFRFMYVFVHVLFRFIGFMFHIDAGTIYMRDWFSAVCHLIVSAFWHLVPFVERVSLNCNASSLLLLRQISYVGHSFLDQISRHIW